MLLTAAPHPSDADLTAFERGQMHGPAWSAVEEHVLQCEECALRLEQCPVVTWAELTGEWRTPSQDATTDTVMPAGGCDSELPAEDEAVFEALKGHARYDVVRRLGAGGMGIVFLARHRQMNRLVALKVLRPVLLTKPSMAERFHQEVLAAAKLSHPNIVTAFDADQTGGLHFLVMEYVAGQSLDQVLKQSGSLPVETVCRWIVQTAAALQHASEHRMVHRDLKPSNLMLTSDGNIKVLDFGLARFVREQMAPSNLTPADVVVGTPDYLAPEQAETPWSADIRADIYSLGCTMYHLLTGRAPFDGASPIQKILAHQQTEAVSALSLRPDLPAALVCVLERMMAKDPRQRYQTPAAVVAALADWSSAAPLLNPVRTAPRWAVRAAALACGIAALLFVTILLFLGTGDGVPKNTDNDSTASKLDEDDPASRMTETDNPDNAAKKKAKHKKKK